MNDASAVRRTSFRTVAQPTCSYARRSAYAGLMGMALLTLGCATAEYARGTAQATRVVQAEQSAGPGAVVAQRQLRRTASLDLRVEELGPAIDRAQSVIDAANGYVENLSAQADESAFIGARVPAASLDTVLEQLSTLGRETGRRITVEDVTDRLVDLNATLQNQRELRERLRALFDRGGKLEDLLRVEMELTRVQTDIERLEAVLASIRKQVELAALNVSLERERRPGPGGVVLRAVGDFLGWFFRRP